MATRARLLVVGDSGVGKTSLLLKMCQQQVQTEAPPHTVGCGVEVLALDADLEMSGAESGFVEFLDVGCHRNYRLSRNIYYHSVDAIVLVYDLCNSKSFTNLRQWIAELRADVRPNPARSTSACDASIAGLPVFVVGTKLDLVRGTRLRNLPDANRLLGFASAHASATRSGDVDGLTDFIRNVVGQN